MKEKELSFEEEQQILYERMQAENPGIKLTKEQEEQGRKNRAIAEAYAKKMREEQGLDY